MTVPPFPSMFISPLDLRRYEPGSRATRTLARQLSEPACASAPEPEPPLRASSVCLARRPQSGRERAPSRARPLSERYAYSQKQFHVDAADRAPSVARVRREAKPALAPSRKPPPPRTPCAVSVKTLSIPMTYLDADAALSPSDGDPSARRSRRSGPRDGRAPETHRNPRGRTGRPPPYRAPRPRRPERDARASETENRLLIQISEADQVSDFERILNSNAILCESKRPGARGAPVAATARAPARPHSHYSVSNVSDAYHFLFQRHVDSVQRLIRDYRGSCGPGAASAASAAASEWAPTDSFLGRHWGEELHDLSEFYDDDRSLQEELQSAADRLLDEEVRLFDERAEPAAASAAPASTARNFNVNLSGLIVATGLRPSSCASEQRASSHEESDDEKEWDASIMSAHCDDKHDDTNDSVAALAQNLTGVQLDARTRVPTITFSDCCDDNVRCAPAAAQAPVHINLSVPSVESGVEARPPPA